VVVFCTATNSGEGHDRANLSLPLAELNLLNSLPNSEGMVVVVTTPGPVLLPFADVR
jgi:hypothetical protein